MSKSPFDIFDIQQKTLVIKILESWLSGEVSPNPHTGICGNLEKYFDIVSCGGVLRMIDSTYQSWDKFSGNYLYPIKFPGIQRANISFCDAARKGETFSRQTVYGRLRWSLVRHITETLKKPT
jgi:hypothetical protein